MGENREGQVLDSATKVVAPDSAPDSTVIRKGYQGTGGDRPLDPSKPPNVGSAVTPKPAPTKPEPGSAPPEGGRPPDAPKQGTGK